MEDGFDLTAAGLRADDADVAVFVEVLAAKLEGALGGECEVKRRRRGPLARRTRVERLAVALGDRRFVLHRRRRELIAEVESTVHDMRSKVDEVSLEVWLAALQEELNEQARSSARARAALERLLDA